MVKKKKEMGCCRSLKLDVLIELKGLIKMFLLHSLLVFVSTFSNQP